MWQLREKSSQAAKQQCADHAQERAQEELQATQWQASTILSEAKQEADHRLEVCTIREAQGAAVAYVLEDSGDRFNGAQGVGGAYCDY